MESLITILPGDCRDSMRSLAPRSIHCCVTSPPYWGLRDYGLQPVRWEDGAEAVYGLEPTIEAYLAHTVEIFRAVHRVLRDDGTLWLNLGDAFYNGDKGGHARSTTGKQQSNRGTVKGLTPNRLLHDALKPKDLIGLPWRVAFALQADGWYLRTEIVWHKSNPMPESVRDRPTRAHEYIFLLTKSPKYFYDAEAVKEPISQSSHARISQKNFFNQKGGEKDYGNGINRNRSARKAIEGFAAGVHAKLRANGPNSRMSRERTPKGDAHKPNASLWNIRPKQNASFAAATTAMVATRNKRSVWTLASAPFKGAHFATFPPKLITPCILAGTSERGACPLCGAQWQRIVAPTPEYAKLPGRSYHAHEADGVQNGKRQNGQGPSTLKGMRTYETSGWRPGCCCYLNATPESELLNLAERAETIPSVVLDPFAGSGTTGQVALRHGRRAILCEAQPDYVALIKQRLASALTS